MKRWVVIPVIARIEIARRRASLWILVQQVHTRRHLPRVPVDQVVDLGGDGDAETLIDLIRGGRELPVGFVQRLHVID